MDFSQVKAVPILSVLAHYGIKARPRKGNQFIADCPLPSHARAEHKKDTFSINTESNIFYCHSETCRAASSKPKGGDVIDLVTLMEGLKPKEAAQKILGLKPGPVVVETGVNKPLGFKLEGLEYHPEIEKRGISKETAQQFGVGFFGRRGSMARRIVFPLYEHGNLIGYVGRTVEPVTPENPKWKFPPGLQKTFLYGIEWCDPAKPVILCESPWMVLYAKQRGGQAASMLGKELTEGQERQLEPFKEIILALDNDEEGKKAAAKLANRLTGKRIRKASLQG